MTVRTEAGTIKKNGGLRTWIDGNGSWVSKLTLLALQMFLIISVYNLIRYFIFSANLDQSLNIMTIFTGSVFATIVAYLILYKYQTVIRDFTLQNARMGEQIDKSTEELLASNKEMRLEIAERKAIEAALAESEARFRTIVREAALGIAIIDLKGRLIECNPALQKMLGHGPEKLSNMVFFHFDQNDAHNDAELNKKPFKELFKGKRGNINIEKRFINNNGQEGWWRQSISVVRNPKGEAQFMISLIEDITEQKRAREEVKKYQARLKSLASELSLTEERERRTLATILHDQIGQMLSLAKIKMEEMHDSHLNKRFKGSINEVNCLIENTIQYTRSLIFELSPPLLYDVGFAATVEWLAENIRKQYGLNIQLEICLLEERLDNEKRFLLFRAVRELLFNIIKHAKASLAKIYIQGDDSKMQVIVEDNGVGFPPDKIPTQVLAYNELSGFGLFSIYERLTYLGGRLEIESNPHQGTAIIMEIPLGHNEIKSPEEIKLSVFNLSELNLHGQETTKINPDCNTLSD